MNHDIRERKPTLKKRQEKANSALQHVRTDFRSMMNKERLNAFMTQILII